jgi:hypothetical protein
LRCFDQETPRIKIAAQSTSAVAERADSLLTNLIRLTRYIDWFGIWPAAIV